MGHGTPDWWGSEPGETTFQVQDVGELAARLGSIDTFDRRGNVVWLTGFEEGLAPITTSVDGTGASAVLSATQAKFGAYSIKLTAGSDGGMNAFVIGRSPYPVLGAWGAEASFTVATLTGYIPLSFILYDGTNYHYFRIRYDHVNKTLDYLNSLNSWVSFATGVDLYAYDSCFHVFKLVVDFSADKYLRAIIDENEYSLAGIAGRVVLSAVAPHLFFSLAHYGRAGNNPYIYADGLIITQNEPS